MGLIQDLKDRYKGYKEKRFLETHGCKTWREYELKHDPDVGYLARWVHTYYHGYPHIWHLSDKLAAIPTRAKPGWYWDQVKAMTVWCEQNCQGKWRNDFHRGFWDHHGNYEFNGMGGGDIMFFAFKEESDFMWFTLTFG